MNEWHERLLAAAAAERNRLSRRRLLGRAAGLATGGVLAAVGLPDFGRGARAQTATPAMGAAPFANDVDVLNYALTLEHLEYTFYRDGVGKFAFGAGPFGKPIGPDLEAIRDHEGAHVETLTEVIRQLGGTPVTEGRYDFGYGDDPQTFLMTAQALENTGVRAYDGAGQYLSDPALLTAAGGIVAVEARHASYLNLIHGAIPFPEAFEASASPAQIMKIVTPFVVAA
ncbi:MAG TPA: ferritin-like domain-containing protein [Thermomicrobiales bacterium]|nr:ferritin-like domain-containing protein [Thermomicrobiales bacterium]